MSGPNETLQLDAWYEFRTPNGGETYEAKVINFGRAAFKGSPEGMLLVVVERRDGMVRIVSAAEVIS